MSGHVIERLSPFLDGEVLEAERREIQSHLESCADCATQLADLAAVDAMARGLTVDAPPGYFEALPGRVRQRLRGQQPRRLPVWGWAAAAALLIAVLLPRLSYEPSAPKPATTAARVPAPPPPPPPSPVLEEVRPATKAVPGAAGQTSVSGGLRSSAPAARERRDEPQPDDSLGQDEVKTEAARAPTQTLGYVSPPAAAPVPQTTTRPAPAERAPEKSVADEAEQQKLQKPSALNQTAPLAAGAVSKERRKQAFEDKGTADAKEDVREKDALASAPRSAPEARVLRESARERARRHPGGAEGDTARLQMVEAGARAYELGGDPRDLEILQQDAKAYLERRDARHPEQVRERLRSLEARP